MWLQMSVVECTLDYHCIHVCVCVGVAHMVNVYVEEIKQNNSWHFLYDITYEHVENLVLAYDGTKALAL